MPINAFPPELIVDGELDFVPSTIIQNFFPVKYGGYVWVGLINRSVSELIYIYRSDDGNIWQAVDAANGWDPEWAVEMDYDDTAKKWWFINVNSARDTITVRYFDLTTGLWSGDVTSFTVTGGVIERANVTHRSGTSLTVMWTLDEGSNTRTVWFDTYDGSVWAGPTQITEFLSTSFFTAPSLTAGTVDAGGAVHSFVYAPTIPFDVNSTALYHVRIAGGAYVWSTVLTDQAIGTDFRKTVVAYKPGTDEIVLAITHKPTPVSFLASGVLRGTPSTAPVFTIEYAVNPFDGEVEPSLIADQSKVYSTLSLVWADEDSGGNPAQNVWRSDNSGSGWGVPVLVWSHESNLAEQPTGGALNSMEGIWATRFPDGTKGYFLGWVTDGELPGGGQKTVHYLDFEAPDTDIIPRIVHNYYSYLGYSLGAFQPRGGYSLLA